MSKRFLIVLIGLILLVIPVMAQDNIGVTTGVTDDEVNEIAAKLYCPVCENIPLDTCGTEACDDWREEIRLQLENGRTEQQIIDDFVARFGDRVVGTPKDPTLRNLSLITPWILIGLLAVGLISGVLRWRSIRMRNASASIEDMDEHTTTQNDLYRNILEQDVAS